MFLSMQQKLKDHPSHIDLKRLITILKLSFLQVDNPLLQLACMLH
jgi:hypothetical protein